MLKYILFFPLHYFKEQDMLKRHQYEIKNGEEDPCDNEF